MSNGEQCCALEICCPPAERRARLGAAIAQFVGIDPAQGEKVLDWMDHEDLAFAPASIRDVFQTVAAHVRLGAHE
jgi:hypothetical protein